MGKYLIAKSLLQSKVIVINVGLDTFLEVFSKKNTSYTHVDWKPPARGNADLMDALRKLSSGK